MERARKTPPQFRKAMAHQIKRSKTTKGKQRQIKKWFDLVREAFQGSGYNATGDK